MRIILLLLLVCSAVSGAPSKKYSCGPAGPTRGLVWGHNHASVDLSTTPIKSLRGIVRALGDQPVDGALVEVLIYSANSSATRTEDDARSRRRLAACVTARDGLFDFDLPSGSYELLTSKPDWNSTSVLVTIDKRRGRQRDIVIPLRIGD